MHIYYHQIRERGFPAQNFRVRARVAQATVYAHMHTEPSPKANYGSGSVPTCIGSVAGAEARGRLRTCLARLLLRGSSGGAGAVLEEPQLCFLLKNGSFKKTFGRAPLEEPEPQP